MKAVTTLIVLQVALYCRMSSAVTAGNFLGVTPVLQTISPSIYPLRTALDVLQPHGFRYGLPFQGFYPQYPVQYPTFLTVRSPFINTFPSTLTPIRTVEQPKEVTEVVEEEEVAEEPSAAVGEITIREHIDALPSLPSSPFRDANPVIPAGIVQATQPQFIQTIFKNPKLSPSLQFVINSKVSPFLQEIKASGVEKL